MFYSNQIESSANIDNHPYPTNVYQKALFQEVCASATIPYTMAGRDVSQVPTGVNVTNRIVPTGMPSPNETRNVLIPAHRPVPLISIRERAEMSDLPRPMRYQESFIGTRASDESSLNNNVGSDVFLA